MARPGPARRRPSNGVEPARPVGGLTPEEQAERRRRWWLRFVEPSSSTKMVASIRQPSSPSSRDSYV
ncbi:hypothetical protein NL676_006796 [Syzygium grande]|nr:hypothetical protein NL676_006796 [Syzygium grande]